MVVCAFITGSIWAVDKIYFAKNRNKLAAALGDDGSQSDENIAEQETVVKEPLHVELSRALFPIIVAVLVLRSFLVEPFRIPSGSMMPTLLVGDFILVNKYAYGLRLPVLNTKILDIGHPKHGDVVVFRFPKDPTTDYIKRVIGVPGDTIRYFNKQLFLNGKLVVSEKQGVYQGTCSGVTSSGNTHLTEDLDGVKHSILLDYSEQTALDYEQEVIIKEGEYFVMGDNRDNSNDSRRWGTVPEANLVGKAVIVWMNWDKDSSCWGFDRIGNKIH